MTIEKLVRHLIDDIGVGQHGDGVVVIRSGKLGACVATRLGGLEWFPAYFSGQLELRVMDVTGGKSNVSAIRY